MRRAGLLAALVLFFATPQLSSAQDKPEVLLLWPNGAPGALGDEAKDKPQVTVYHAPADKAQGTAVVICPGGGYGGLAMDHEGHQIARWLNPLSRLSKETTRNDPLSSDTSAPHPRWSPLSPLISSTGGAPSSPSIS